jgi:hypothetical protein
VGEQTVKRPAYYAPVGSRSGDLVALLHPPYTAWHLSHVAIGAALAPRMDWRVLGATLLAFFLGTGIAAHALDERNGRPLHTTLSDRVLTVLTLAGFVGALAVAVIGAVELSPWVLAWAVIGIALAAGYALERPPVLHTTLGFALAWGGFPVLVGYWAQARTVTPAAVAVAGAATLISMAQRALSTPARYLRRNTDSAEMVISRDHREERWSDERILATWERPLRLLAWAMVTLALGLLASRAMAP